MKISNNSYFACEGWMVNELGLRGLDLMLFSLIYNITAGSNNLFWGSRAFMGAWLGCCENTVDVHLKHLLARGYIERKVVCEKGVEKITYLVCRYPGDTPEEHVQSEQCNSEDKAKAKAEATATVGENAVFFSPTASDSEVGVLNTCTGGTQKSEGGCSKTEYNNKPYNTLDNELDTTAPKVRCAPAARCAPVAHGVCDAHTQQTAERRRVAGNGRSAGSGRSRGSRGSNGGGNNRGNGGCSNGGNAKKPGDVRAPGTQSVRKAGTMSSFETADFFEAALKRSLGEE